MIDCEKNCFIFNFTHCHQQCMSAKTVIFCVLKNLLISSELSLNICMMSVVSIICFTQCKNHQLFITFMTNIEKALASQKTVNVLIKLFSEYHKFAILFSQKKFNKLFSHCIYNHTILLLSDKEPLKSFLYNMFKDELLILQKYLKKHLFKSFI